MSPRRLVALALASSLAGCVAIDDFGSFRIGDDDGGSGLDAGAWDAGVSDAGVDGGADSGSDASSADGSTPDASSDAGRDASTDAGLAGGGAVTSAQIEAVRMSPDGAVDVRIERALITYVMGAVGGDRPGLFLQAEALGPAIFIATDPTLLLPLVAVGQEVSVHATAVGTVDGVRAITSFDGWTVHSQGHSVEALVQDVSSAADLVTALGSYESELVRGTFRVTGPTSPAGTGFVAASADTIAVVSDPSLSLRVESGLDAMYQLSAGCVVTLGPAPLGRSGAVARPTARRAADVVATMCPAPRVVSAISAGTSFVSIELSRSASPGSVLPDGSQFVFNGGLSATSATVSGRRVTVGTSAQSPGAAYTVTVAASVTDTTGVPLDPSFRTASFVGYTSPAGIILNEVDYDQVGTDNAELVEVFNPTGAAINVAGVSIVMVNASNGLEYSRVTLTGTLPAGGYAVAGSPLVSAPGAAIVVPLPLAVNAIQNGMPDIILLLGPAGELLDAVSYEDPTGAVPSVVVSGITYDLALAGAATGAADADAAPGSIARLPNGVDRNLPFMDWAFTATPTPGAPNM